ncbi:MAG: iron-sulfur cluster assembly scaffold protein [Sphingopyxis sp.]|nr:iron-sulfur cluster assembly scaffold protein [Sphingopyxis sp.]
MSAPLYTREILALAVALADYPRLDAPMRSGDLRAPLCGSRVALDLIFAPDGCVAQVGLAVEACALGQAAATLFARGAPGRSAAQLAATHEDLANWLQGWADAPPDWPDIATLAPARDYPARHAAILLPFALAARLAREVAAA